MLSNFKSKRLEQVRPRSADHKRASALGRVEGELGAASRRGRALSTDKIGPRSEGRAGDRINGPAGVRGKSNLNQDIVSYGEETAWTSLAWAVIGILCACALAVLVFVR